MEFSFTYSFPQIPVQTLIAQCAWIYIKKKILLNQNVDVTNAATLLIGKVYKGLYLAYSRLCEEAG